MARELSASSDSAVAAALVGFGMAARLLHAPLMRSAGLRIVGVLTRQAAAVRALLPGAQVLDELEALLQLQPLELVVIATPNHLHVPQALSALRAGKHVVIDKPFALNLADADELMSAAQRAGRKLAVFHNRRWDADFLTLRRLLRQGRLGDIHYFEARWDRYRPQVSERWRERADAGGGVLNDLGPHLIDQAVQLFGQPQWLQASVFAQRAGALVDDGFDIRLGAGPLRIVLAASSVAADHGLRYRLHGSSASYRKCGLDVQEEQLRRQLSPLDDAFGIEPESQWGHLVEGSGAAHVEPSERGDWAAFYRLLRVSIETDGPVPVSAADARQVLAIIDAARRANQSGCRISLNGPACTLRA